MSTRAGLTCRAALCATLVGVAGCKQDQGFVERPLEYIAVATGDFDAVEVSLDRLLVPYQTYEGYISEPTYETDADPANMALKVETLLTGETDDGLEIDLFDAVFLNSGVRGAGAQVYNSTEDDDAFVADAAAVDNLRDFVESGGVLFASDWAYDLVEAAFPDAIEFYGDDAAYDVAQAGSPGTVTASVDDAALAEFLGVSPVSLSYNYSHWSVIESVGEGTSTWMSGDVEYRVSASEGYDTLSGVPLLVSFEAGGGQVVYSTFHVNAQTAQMIDAAIDALIPGLPTSSDEAADPTPTEAE